MQLACLWEKAYRNVQKAYVNDVCKCISEKKRVSSVLKYFSLYSNISFDERGTFYHKKGHFWALEKIFWGGMCPCAPPPGSYATGVDKYFALCVG